MKGDGPGQMLVSLKIKAAWRYEPYHSFKLLLLYICRNFAVDLGRCQSHGQSF
jgi:hypothetical protein